jgi:hypothetical protein
VQGRREVLEEALMWFTGFQIPLRYKLYLLAAAAFVLGLFRWRNVAVSDALDELRDQQKKAAEKALRTSLEVRDQVEILDDVGLRDRAYHWVRKRND